MRARLNIHDAGSPLVDDCGAASIFLKKLVVPLKYAVQRAFAAVQSELERR